MLTSTSILPAAFSTHEAAVLKDRTLSVGSQQQLVAVDAALPNLNNLLRDMGANQTVVFVAPNQDAVEVIGRALAETRAKSIAIVAHGAPGRVFTGCNELNRISIESRAKQIRAWDVDKISLFCCYTGAESDFTEHLSDLSGAEVFASEAIVGHAELGGQWQLQNSLGMGIEIPFSVEAQAQ